MIENVNNIKVGKVDEKINYSKFSAPTINIYDKELNKKMLNKFIQFGPKITKEIGSDVEKDG